MSEKETEPKNGADNVITQFNEIAKAFGGGVTDNRFTTAWHNFMQALGKNPEVLSKLGTRHAACQSELLQSLSGDANGTDAEKPADCSRSDPRFRHETWHSNPFYRYLKDSYLLNSQMMREVVASVELDKESKVALEFMMQQMISASSPSNFAVTNPEVLDATIESKGDNLRRGMENYMRDMKAGAITQVDPDAFTIGENIVLAPGKVVAQNHLMQLIEYQATTTKVNARPLLIIPPCINKYYILDLSPDNSFIQHLIASGQRVFLVSWVNASERQAQLGWDDYVAAGVIEALTLVHEISGNKPVHTLGYCIGGTLLACALSILKQREVKLAASMSLLTTMLDFVDTGQVGLFIDEKFVTEQETKFAQGGVFDGNHLRRIFAYIRPNDLVWPYVVRNYMLGETPPAFDILHWNADSINLPGGMYAWFLRHTYLDNDLKSGDVEVCGTKVDYAGINLPGMVVATERDHIVPSVSAYASVQALANKNVEYVLATSGHVAGVVNPPARKKGYHFIATKLGAKLPADQAAWLKQAKRIEGSWWNRYVAWLNKRGGGKVVAPKEFGNYRYRPLEDAPGSYLTAPLPEVKN